MMETAKGTLFIFHTKIITELTFPSNMTALENPLCHSEFDVLESLGKNLTLLANKIASAIISSRLC